MYCVGAVRNPLSNRDGILDGGWILDLVAGDRRSGKEIWADPAVTWARTGRRAGAGNGHGSGV